MTETPSEPGSEDIPAEDGGATERSGPGADPGGDAGSSPDDESGSAEGQDSDDGHDYPDHLESLSMEEAVSLLGEETRARILVELGSAVREDGVHPDALSFSELMDRVGAEDSGRFNYHLEKLVGTFVHGTDDGYVLAWPGHLFYRAIVSGQLTSRELVEPFEVGPCPDCGEPLVAQSPTSSIFFVRCRACETFEHAVELSPSGFERRTPREALAVAFKKRYHEGALMRQGICHSCGATVERRLDAGDYEFWEDTYGYDVYAAMSCSVCSVGGVGHPAFSALVTPSVVAFFDDHGRDAFAAVPWGEALSSAKTSTTVHDDGNRVTVPFELAGDRLAVTLDDDLEVVATERE